MTCKNCERLRELIEDMRARINHCIAGHAIHTMTAHMIEMRVQITEALSPDTCETCGGTKEVEWDYDDPEVMATVKAKAPCPTCQQQKPPEPECELCGDTGKLRRTYPVADSIDPAGERSYMRDCDCQRKEMDAFGEARAMAREELQDIHEVLDRKKG